MARFGKSGSGWAHGWSDWSKLKFLLGRPKGREVCLPLLNGPIPIRSGLGHRLRRAGPSQVFKIKS